jgi:hypothetical protein
MAINVPVGGTNWDNLPRHVTPEQRDNYIQWVNRYATQYGVPTQVLMNMLTQESNWQPGITSNRGAQGIAQIMPGTATEIATALGMPNFDPYNPEHGIQGGAYYLGRIYNQYYGNSPNGDWGHVAAGYNWGPNRPRLRNWGPETQDWLRNNNSETWNYYQALTRGLVPPLTGTQWGFAGTTPIGTGTGTDDSVPPPLGSDWGFGPGNDTFYRGGGIDQPDLGGGTALGPNQDFLDDVTSRSAAAGYELPAGVADFLWRTVPTLGQGPEGFGEGAFPWFNPGQIDADVGAVLQHHALMPNNLIYNPETQMWDVPNERRFPSNTGIWGAEQVASQLPELGEGFNRDYLTHLGYGATQEHNSGGLSNSYWGAPNLYGAPPSGNIYGGGSGGYPAPPYGTGNNYADMSTPQPIDYTSYYGALGNTGSNWQPNFNGTFGEFDTNQGLAGALSPQYADYFATMGLPNGDFGGGGVYAGNTTRPPSVPFGQTNANGIFNSAYSGTGVTGVPSLGYYTGDMNNLWSATIPDQYNTQVYNSGIGPGGVQIASGVNSQPIGTYNIGPGGIPLAYGF